MKTKITIMMSNSVFFWLLCVIAITDCGDSSPGSKNEPEEIIQDIWLQALDIHSTEPDLVELPGDLTNTKDYEDTLIDFALSDENIFDSAKTNCNPRAKLVYVVADDQSFLSFHPDTLNFALIGTLKCNAAPSQTPFSMSVDRNADAWILYSDGTLFKVSTLNASCESTTFQQGQAGVMLFGMGFPANEQFSNQETLFISSLVGSGLIFSEQSQLGSISFPDLKLTLLAPLPLGYGSAELTGTGLGELWGFFPEAMPPTVAQINKTNGSLDNKIFLFSEMLSNVEAWAFAFWGGYFYLFFKSFDEPSTNVFSINTANNDFNKVLENIGYNITGAGVSSCAPINSP